MSLSHKAFAFDWHNFAREFAPLLLTSLADDDPRPLIDFGTVNLSSLSDPYEGVPLTNRWIDSMEVGDVQEIADYVMTKYYNPAADSGIGDLWHQIERSLTPTQRVALLGQSFGPISNPFDPGRTGSYFQNEVTTQNSLAVFETATRPEMTPFLSLLRDAVRSKNGIYVTF